MNKERRAAGRVSVPLAAAVGGSSLLLPCFTQQEGEMAMISLPLPLSPLTPQLLHGLAPGRWQGWGPCCPFIPCIVLFPAAPLKTLHKGACPVSILKAVLTHLSSWGRGRPGGQDTNSRSVPSSCFQPGWCKREKYPGTEKPESIGLI